MNAAPGSGPRPGTDAWVAAVHGSEYDERALGSGFLIDDRRVLTCAHVACPGWEKQGELWVAFPKSDQFMDRRLRVREVVAPESPAKRRAQDVAVLVLDERVPGEAAARLRRPAPAALVGEAWWAFGFPDGDLFGNSSDGTVGEALAYGWVRLDTSSRYPVKSGYSGAALWSPTYQSVVGLVGQASGSGDARAFTLHQADKCLPEQKLALLADWSAEAAGETALAAWGWTLDEDPEAGRHWRPRARGVSTDAERGFRFRGRTAALSEIVDWMTCAAAPRQALVVTGSPGVGKSAVLGRVVTSADPGIAASLPADDEGVRAPPGSVSCAVHAKGKTALEVAKEIASAASAPPPERASELADVLRTALTERPARPDTPFVVVIDALDEATSAQQARMIARHIAIPLAETCADLQVRVVVGSRRGDDAGSLLDPFGPAARVIDLDDPAFFAAADLVAYTMATLRLQGDERPDNPYGEERTALPVATRIAELADANFLVAGLTARGHGLHDTRAVPPAAIAFTPTVAAALQEYLARLPAVDGAPAAEVLSVLAYAEAPGLPLALWREGVAALTGHRLTENQLRSLARSSAANFLVETGVNEQNTGVFRLFHQALDDGLRQGRATEGSRNEAGGGGNEAGGGGSDADERALARAFLAYGQGVGWDRAPGYLLRSLPRHAVRGRVVDELLADEEYALHADLRRLIPAGGEASGAMRERAQLLRRTPEAIGVGPARRAALFSVTESLQGAGEAYRSTANAGPYRAEWATIAPRDEEAVLEGHTGEIRAVCALGPQDGTLVASAATDGTVRLWDPVTARQVRRLTPEFSHMRGMCGLQVAGQAYLAVASDLNVSLWNETQERSAGRLSDFGLGLIRDLCALDTPEGPVLATATTEGQIILSDPTGERGSEIFEAHSGWVERVCAVELDGETLLASSGDEDDRSIKLWRPGTRECVRVRRGHDASNALTSVRIGRHTMLAGLDADGVICLWDPADDENVHILARDELASTLCSVRVGSRTLLAAPSGDVVRLWDPVTGAAAGTLQGHSDSVDALCVLPVGGRELLASGGADHTVRLWDPEAPRTARTGAVRALSPAYGGTDKVWVAAGGDDGTTRVLQPESASPVVTLRTNDDWVRAVCPVVLDGRAQLVGGGDDGAVWRWDPLDLEVAVGRASPSPAYTICTVSLGGDTLLATGHADGTAQLWDPYTLKVTHTCRFPTGIYAMCPVDVDGHPRVATATDGLDGAVWLWDPASGRRVKHVETHDTYAMCAVPFAGRTALATAHADGLVQLWDARSGAAVGGIASHSGAVNALTVIDGRLLATASSDRTVRLWDLATLSPVEQIPVHHPALAVTWVEGRLIVGLDHGLLALTIRGLSA
ncbi:MULTISPECIES: trypsin-like peptidase domain-containing protein [unclassified Streptomyces]|uniref:trypsin-like peptidase domain-containing protein n=1 Tax=unclassified Streptomyces TaxID=2593676 RepID=UPI00278BF844|nr:MULTISPECIES: trypsin-like peptidase domain-containing protein [unclassified Streptomyces]